MEKIRVVVAEDSLTIRRRIVEVLAADERFEVVGEAADGSEAVELCLRLRPDVITVDMAMPVMSGLAATEQIMARCPTPVLIVSASTNRGDLFQTYDALAAGAVDVFEKPRGDEADEAWERALRSAVRIASHIKVISRPRAQRRAVTPSPDRRFAREEPPRPSPRVVVIGVSTGGPAAVREILRALPPRFPIPILLVIHIGETFGTMLAEWFDGQSPLTVTLARDGDALTALGEGRVVMAPPGRHLVVREGRLRLTDEPERHSCRPSVDVLFNSVAAEPGLHSIAVLLTGMGRDGAEGLLAIRRAGGLTIAQDEETSVVFGMPREAISRGAAERVLPLRQIALALVSAAGDEPRGSP